MVKDESTKVFSAKQEKLVAEILGGKVVVGSGSRPVDPGDVKSYDWLAECKTHVEPGHTIFFDSAVWAKICKEADGTHRKPVLIVDDGSQKEVNTWCLCKPFNIDCSHLLSIDYPFPIRKNISARNDKLKSILDSTIKSYLGEFYIGGYYEVEWEGQIVAVMPISTFKEVCDN